MDALERALYGVAEKGMDGGMAKVGRAVDQRADSSDGRLRVDEVELLLRRREAEGRDAGYMQGHQAASEAWREQNRREVTNAVRGTLELVLTELNATFEQVERAAVAVQRHPRARTSAGHVARAAEMVDRQRAALRALVQQVRTDGVPVP